LSEGLVVVASPGLALDGIFPVVPIAVGDWGFISEYFFVVVAGDAGLGLQHFLFVRIDGRFDLGVFGQIRKAFEVCFV
jgi:hypothetical protein